MKYYLIALIFGIALNISAQDSTSIFAKGRFLTSLYGNIGTDKAYGGIDADIKNTSYTLGSKSGVFVKNNWVLGLNFSLTKAQLSDIKYTVDSEDLLFGLWSRLYFAEKNQVALFAELTPFFSSDFRSNVFVDDNGIVIDETIKGKGLGIEPGLGFTYIINRNVGFGMTLSYQWARINAEKENLVINSKNANKYKTSNLNFGFNFQVYLDQFFF